MSAWDSNPHQRNQSPPCLPLHQLTVVGREGRTHNPRLKAGYSAPLSYKPFLFLWLLFICLFLFFILVFNSIAIKFIKQISKCIHGNSAFIFYLFRGFKTKSPVMLMTGLLLAVLIISYNIIRTVVCKKQFYFHQHIAFPLACCKQYDYEIQQNNF